MGEKVIRPQDVGAGLAIVDDKLVLASATALNVETLPLYQNRDIWAEEAGGTDPNSAEWSFGNGATGFMGLPIDDGWEIDYMYFMADTFPATGSIRVGLCDYTFPSNAAGNVLAEIELTSASDGFGNTNHAWKIEKFGDVNPVSIPQCVLGFRTLAESGVISDARVGAYLRKKVGDYVSNVEINS